MRTKSRLDIGFLAEHFSQLNENPLTTFTSGYRARKARGFFITALFVVWSLVVFLSFSFSFSSSLSAPFPTFPAPPPSSLFLFVLSFCPPTSSVSFLFSSRKIIDRKPGFSQFESFANSPNLRRREEICTRVINHC